jgi:RHS repeat-associated protein
VGLSQEPGVVAGPAAGQRVANRVVVSGWQLYDNKGDVIEKYEPFFATAWSYQPEIEAKRGQHAIFFYDPRGQVIRTVNPDGSEQRVIFGIPAHLEEPDHFEPTPWESFTYDANDLAPLSLNRLDSTESLAERAPEAHHFTPANTILDALGRVIYQVERNGRTPGTGWHLTRSTYDLRGNLLTLTDALGRVAFRHAYDLLDNSLRVESIDAGLGTSVLDAAGNLMEYRDSKSSVALRQYDALNRLTHVWAHDDGDAPLSLREHLIFGDDEAGSGMDARRARQKNLLGRLVNHYDEAGLLAFERYDFKGNPEEKARQVVSDKALDGGWKVDWNRAGAEGDLARLRYQTSMRYDALERPLQIIYPADVNGHRAVLVPRYNRAGALEHVGLDGDTYVEQIAYNARGQRVFIAYGNGIMSRYAHDPNTFRLTRLRTEKVKEVAPGTYAGRGTPLQEFTYRYDLVGNITSIDERTRNCGIAGSPHGRDRLVRRFVYDPLYRLAQAGGRACKVDDPPARPSAQARCGAYDAPFGGGSPVPNQDNAPELTAAYFDQYDYDPAGNLLELHRTVGDSGWRRRFTQAGDSNRLESVRQGSTNYRFQYDAGGNVIRENSERRYTWNYANRLVGFTNQPEGSDHASVAARYLYDAGGRRVKKYVRKNGKGKLDSTIYIDNIFEHNTWQENGSQEENNLLHVMDDQQRLALVRRGPARPNDAGPQAQFHISDHLGSSHVVVNESGDWINREEYFPYGETSFGGYARKRYRFTGKERDEESGLCYHGARYYVPWLARWASCDPAGAVDGLNLYRYAKDNPTCLFDSTGMQSEHNVSRETKGEGIEDPYGIKSVNPETGEKTFDMFALEITVGEDIEQASTDADGATSQGKRRLDSDIPSRDNLSPRVDFETILNEFGVTMEVKSTVADMLSLIGVVDRTGRWQRALGQLDWAIPKAPHLVADVTDTPAWRRVSFIERVTSHPSYRAAGATLSGLAAGTDLIKTIREPSVQNIADLVGSASSFAGPVGKAFSVAYSVGRFVDQAVGAVAGRTLSDWLGEKLFNAFPYLILGEPARPARSVTVEPLESPGRLDVEMIYPEPIR